MRLENAFVRAEPRRLAGVVALLLGVFLIYGVGFAQPAALHDAAHDGRHSFAFPLPLTALYRVVLAGLIAGTIAGLVTAALQAATTWPLISEAERYETPSHAHDHASEPSAAARAALTVLTTVLAGIGFGLILTGAFALTGAPVHRSNGFAWGLAGFAAFSLAPALGLPPALPGAAEADLAARQLWWLATAACTAGGLWLIAFRRGAAMTVLAVALLALPHAIGAPAPEGAAIVPVGLAAEFVVVSLFTSAVFWIVLGVAAGAVYERLTRRA